MKRSEQAAAAERFRALHAREDVLLLPNVWDAVSAMLYEKLGFHAVGTTSAGIASTLGYADGERIGIRDTVHVIERIANILRVPVSADIETGYSDAPDGIADVVESIVRAGAVGVNIEDSLLGTGADHYVGLVDSDRQSERIAAARRRAESLGIPLFINARVDVFLIPATEEQRALDETVRRGNAYLDAGADGVFVPDMGNLRPDAIRQLASRISGPLNLIAGPTTPSVHELNQLGVARLSFGPRPMRTALWHLQEMAREWIDSGTYDRMLEGKLSYSDVNKWFESPR